MKSISEIKQRLISTIYGRGIGAIQLLNSVFNPLSALSQISSVMKGSLPIREKVDKEIDFLSNDHVQEGYKLPDAFDII